MSRSSGERSGVTAVFRQLAELGYNAFVYLPDADTFTPYVDHTAQNVFFLPRSLGV